VSGLKPAFIALPVIAVLAFFQVEMPSSLTIAEEKSPFFQQFPLEIGEWKGTDVAPDEKTLEILETRNVLTRFYETADKNGVHLLLVSSQKDRRVAHPPEVCYLGSNFSIMNERETTPAEHGGQFSVKEFEAIHERRPDKKEHVLYVYRVGDRFTTNYYAQQLQFAIDRFSKNESEVLLIRLAGSEREALHEFLSKLLPLLKK